MSFEFRDFRIANVLANGTQAYRPMGTRRVGRRPNKRLLQSREDVMGPNHSPCGSRFGSACWPRSRIARG